MAFSGFHVSLHEADRFVNKPGSDMLPIYGRLLFSETLSANGTTTLSVSQSSQDTYFARLITSADSWVCIGETPADPSQSASNRMFLQSLQPVDIYVKIKDKFRFCTA